MLLTNIALVEVDGEISHPIRVKVIDKEKVNGGYKFLFAMTSGTIDAMYFGKSTKISSELLVGNTYTISGMDSESRTGKYITDSTSKYILFLRDKKLKYQKAQVKKHRRRNIWTYKVFYRAARVKCRVMKPHFNKLKKVHGMNRKKIITRNQWITIPRLQRRLMKRHEMLRYNVDAVEFRAGEIYRYMGCEVCTKSIPYQSPEKIFHCVRCDRAVGRKSYMIIRNGMCMDSSGNELEFVVYNEQCAKLLGKQSSEYIHEGEAQQDLEKLFRSKVALRLKCPSDNDLVAERLTILSPPQDTDTDSETEDDGDVTTDNPESASGFVGDSIENYPVEIDPADVEITIPENFSFVTETRNAYETRSHPPGLVLLINNKNFPFHEDKVRDGSELDVHKVLSFYTQLGYEIFGNAATQDVQSLKELIKILDNYKKALIAANCDSSLVYIMSHGVSNEIELCEGTRVNFYYDVLPRFSEENFPEFIGKPQIFFVATCQGFAKSEKCLKSVPSTFSNVLVSFASAPGENARRSRSRGSFYIQTMIDVFSKDGHKHHVFDMLHTVQSKLQKKKVKTRKIYQMPIHFKMNFRSDYYFPVQNLAAAFTTRMETD